MFLDIFNFSKTLTLMIILFGLFSCSREPFGTELSTKFDNINTTQINDEPQENKKEENRNQLQGKLNKNDLRLFENKVEKKANNQQSKKKITNNYEEYVKDKDISKQSKPYRIIIKLTSSDPTSPAEVVTELLNKAGISFEVEKIESLYDGK